ncbi:hypothetical protein D3C77_814640 [compost metagenome]
MAAERIGPVEYHHFLMVFLQAFQHMVQGNGVGKETNAHILQIVNNDIDIG